MTIYTVQIFETFRFRADLAQASAPIEYEGADGEWVTTQYQTADACHDVGRAARLALSACGRDYFAAPGDERDDDEILDELLDGVDVEAEPEEGEW